MTKPKKPDQVAPPTSFALEVPDRIEPPWPRPSMALKVYVERVCNVIVDVSVTASVVALVVALWKWVLG